MEDKSFDDDNTTKSISYTALRPRAGCIRRSLDGFVLLVISLNLADGPTILVLKHQHDDAVISDTMMCTMHIVHSVQCTDALMSDC